MLVTERKADQKNKQKLQNMNTNILTNSMKQSTYWEA